MEARTHRQVNEVRQFLSFNSLSRLQNVNSSSSGSAFSRPSGGCDQPSVNKNKTSLQSTLFKKTFEGATPFVSFEWIKLVIQAVANGDSDIASS